MKTKDELYKNYFLQIIKLLKSKDNTTIGEIYLYAKSMFHQNITIVDMRKKNWFDFKGSVRAYKSLIEKRKHPTIDFIVDGLVQTFKENRFIYLEIFKRLPLLPKHKKYDHNYAILSQFEIKGMKKIQILEKIVSEIESILSKDILEKI